MQLQLLHSANRSTVILNLSDVHQWLDSPVLEFLGKAEIGKFEMSLPVEQQVLGFEISVDETERVEVFERQDDLGGVEQRRAGNETTGVSQVREQFASTHVLQQHVQEPLVVIGPQSKCIHVASHYE